MCSMTAPRLLRRSCATVLLFGTVGLDDAVVDPVCFVSELGCPRAGHLIYLSSRAADQVNFLLKAIGKRMVAPLASFEDCRNSGAIIAVHVVLYNRWMLDMPELASPGLAEALAAVSALPRIEKTFTSAPRISLLVQSSSWEPALESAD